MAKGLLRQKFWEKTKALVKPKGLLRKKFAEKKAAASALSAVPLYGTGSGSSPIIKSDAAPNQILRKVNSETEIALKTDIPEIPVKSVKQNGAELTPDSNGAVNVKGVYYATCDTAQNTTAKVATLSKSNETFALEEGVVVYVKFIYPAPTSSSLNTTLNVAGTGAKTIKTLTGGGFYGNGDYIWYANSIIAFVYDGTDWRMQAHGHASNTTGGVVKLAYNFGNYGQVAAEGKGLYAVGTDIAPAWIKSTSVSYSAGDYVIYIDGKLYKAKVDIPANTAWSASNWQAVTVMADTKTALDNKSDKNHTHYYIEDNDEHAVAVSNGKVNIVGDTEVNGNMRVGSNLTVGPIGVSGGSTVQTTNSSVRIGSAENNTTYQDGTITRFSNVPLTGINATINLPSVDGTLLTDNSMKTLLAKMPQNLDTYDNAIQAIGVLWDIVYRLAYGKDRSN